ncbi:hypothetical protein TWF730_008500 [Orbilia blumenaviensis]|uniref:Uncharacterized protein n=1 Tax=Orbilia blumenaviensis TaxID=1796055 RepID=A0AAV9V2I7_9PEZI
MHSYWAKSVLLLLPFAQGILAQSGSSTTTIFQTVYNTYTITKSIACESLRICEDITFSAGFLSTDGNGTAVSPATSVSGSSSPSSGQGGSTSVTSGGSGITSVTGATSGTGSGTSVASPSATNSDIPSEFLLRGDGLLGEHYIAFDDDGATSLVASGQEPRYLQLSSLGQLVSSSTSTGTTRDIVFLRINNNTLPRRQNDTELVEIGDLLHAIPSELLSTDKTESFYFVGSELYLNWKGLIYTFYAVPRNVTGVYSLKMARMGSTVPSSFLPLTLNYLGRTSSTSSGVTTASGTGTGSGMGTATNSGAGSTGEASGTGSGTITGTDSQVSTTGVCTGGINPNPNSISGNAYDIITSFGYEHFCSQYLLAAYSGTAGFISISATSTLVVTVPLTATEVIENTVYTNTETIYTETTTLVVDATAQSRLARYMAPQPIPDVEPSKNRRFIPYRKNKRRQSQVSRPPLLVSFSDDEIQGACLSAVPNIDLSPDHITKVDVIPGLAVDQATTRTTIEIPTASPLIQPAPLEVLIPGNGYWKIVDPDLPNFDGQYLTVIHNDGGYSYGYVTKATASSTIFKVKWNTDTSSYNAYWEYTFTSGGTETTQIRWLWYYINREALEYMTPQELTDEQASSKTRELRKAEFIVDSEGRLKVKGDLYMWVCLWNQEKFINTIYVFWGQSSGFLEGLKLALTLAGDTDSKPYDCKIISNSIKIVSDPGSGVGR